MSSAASSGSAAPASSHAPPLLATRAAYVLLTDTCKAYVAAHQADAARPASSSSSSDASLASPVFTPEHVRQVKNALNSMSQSVFLTVRRHLRVRGRVEAEDPSLQPQVLKAQEELKAERMALHALHVRAAQLIDATLRAPLSHLDPNTGLALGEAPVQLLTAAELPAKRREGAAAAEAEARAALKQGIVEVSLMLPRLLATGENLSEVLAGRGAQPLSQEVRATLEKVNKEAAKAKSNERGAVGAAAKAAAKLTAEAEAAATGGFGKVAKSPSARSSVRKSAAKPY